MSVETEPFSLNTQHPILSRKRRGPGVSHISSDMPSARCYAAAMSYEELLAVARRCEGTFLKPSPASGFGWASSWDCPFFTPESTGQGKERREARRRGFSGFASMRRAACGPPTIGASPGTPPTSCLSCSGRKKNQEPLPTPKRSAGFSPPRAGIGFARGWFVQSLRGSKSRDGNSIGGGTEPKAAALVTKRPPSFPAKLPAFSQPHRRPAEWHIACKA